MVDEIVLGIDQGTGSTRAVVMDTSGSELASFAVPAPPRSIEGRNVHQDAALILATVKDVVRQSFAWAEGERRALRAIGIAFQRSGVLAWKAETGAPVSPLLTWADTSTYRKIEDLGTTAIKISDRTGIPTIANFAAGKIARLQHDFPWPGEKIATLDAYVLWDLGGRTTFATEDSMAARTMLYELVKPGSWSSELARHFKVDIARLPWIRCTVDDFGLIDGVPLKVSIGDQQAALLGRITSEGYPLLNLGTIASLLVPTGGRPVFKPSLMSSVWFSRKNDRPKPQADRAVAYLTEMTSPVTGPLIQELIEKKKMAADLPGLSKLCEESLAAGRKIVAYSQFGRAMEPKYPDGMPDFIIKGPDADYADIARAYVENVGFMVTRMIEQFDEYRLCFADGDRSLMVAGGGSELDYLVQHIADCSSCTLVRLPSKEATARGAALATLIRDDLGEDARSLNSLAGARRFVPQDATKRDRYLKWKRFEHDLLAGNVPPQATVMTRS